MVRSMTGYSKVRLEDGGLSLNVAVKTVNHRFLDLQFRMPMALSPMEAALRRIVKNHIVRGHVEVSINLEAAGAEELKVNRELLKAYIKVCREVQDELGSAGEPDVVQLLRIPGVLSNENELSEKELAAARKVLESALTEALDHSRISLYWPCRRDVHTAAGREDNCGSIAPDARGFHRVFLRRGNL